MTTILDPAGSPVITYNRSGTAIVAVTALPGSSQATAAPIPRFSGWTVAMIDEPYGNLGVRLPDDAEVGDLVECHLTSDTGSFALWPEAGGRIGIQAVNTLIIMSHCLMRRVAPGVWYPISIIPSS